MCTRIRTPRGGRRLALGGLACLALAGCGSSAGLNTVTTVPVKKAGTAATGSNSGSMAGMDMSGSSKSMSVDGIKPIPTQTLATAEWQEMRITARAMTAVPFVIFNGTTEQMVKPPKHTSFHLMVMLNDARSNVPIPYAGVWATIHKAGKLVYDERQWPMLSEYMGPHYGNNVSLPGAGHYELTLLISPPVAARHLEYQNVWLKPHQVTMSFNWNPNT
jgi:hypothetical protein